MFMKIRAQKKKDNSDQFMTCNQRIHVASLDAPRNL